MSLPAVRDVSAVGRPGSHVVVVPVVGFLPTTSSDFRHDGSFALSRWVLVGNVVEFGVRDAPSYPVVVRHPERVVVGFRTLKNRLQLSARKERWGLNEEM